MIDYIHQKRIEKAAHLLTSTAHSIQDIALKVGYNDINYFTRKFKKHFQMTPSVYRQKYHT